MKSEALMRGVRFEVHGRVQGVFFRRSTQEEAERLQIKGWARNTPRQTVEGEAVGQDGDVAALYLSNSWD